MATCKWASLPDDLLDSIFQKFCFCAPDYLVFSSVCKSWNCSALKHKERWLSNHRLPCLLMKIAENFVDNQRNTRLYNFTTRAEIRDNFELQIPDRYKAQRWVFSSYGWLVFNENCFSLVLLQPQSSAVIRLPPLKNDQYIHGVNQVILSRDPCFGSFEVLATSYFQDKVAHLKYGDEFWAYSETRTWVFHDVMFYGGRVFSVCLKGSIMSLDIDPSSKHIKVNVISPVLNFRSMGLIKSYFVISTNGDLLLVHKFLKLSGDHNKGSEKLLLVYKLMMNSNGVFTCILIPDLGGDSLFLGPQSQSVSVLASMYPAYCEANLVYETFGGHIKIFNLKEGSIKEKLVNLDTGLATWIVPPMKM